MEKIVIANRYQKISHNVLVSDGDDADIISITIDNIPQNVREISILMGGCKIWTYLRDLHFDTSLKITQPIPTRKCRYHNVHVCFEYNSDDVKSEYIAELEYQLADECQTVYDEYEDRYVTGRVANLVTVQKEVYYLMVNIPDVCVERGNVDTCDVIPFWEYVHYTTSLENPLLKVEQVTEKIYRVQNFVRFVSGMSGKMYCHCI